MIVVKAEHRTSIPGIVHGASTSGASLFLEPLSTVEINNDIVALEEQEAEEVRRILLALTERFRARPVDLRADDRRRDRARRPSGACAVLRLDRRRRTGADRPTARSSCRRRAHPAARSSAVPGHHQNHPARARCLLITGPNTGGKTVALKTAGLLALMAQAGCASRRPTGPGCRCSAPCSPTSATSSRSTRASARSPGTSRTSRRWTARSDCRRSSCSMKSASGTDPIEGGALGVAVVDHFRRRGAMVDRDEPLRRAEDLRVDDRRRGERGVRLRRRDVRADLSAALRIAGTQSGARDRHPPRPRAVDRRPPRART